MIKHAKCRIEAGSAFGADPVRIRYGAASLKGKSAINDLLGMKLKRFLAGMDSSGVTIIVKGTRTEEVLKELGDE